MRVLITADLHYDIRRSREPAEQLARKVCRKGGDALVLVGDTAGADLRTLRECLELFAEFPGKRLMVMGNHCLWCQGGQSSMDRYERLVPATASQAGFEVLDHSPQTLGRSGLVGSVGWYDYSYRDESLHLPLGFYRAKVTPGAARYYGTHGELLDRHHGQLREEHMRLGARWMDGVHVELGMSDEQFLEMLAEKLAGQLAELSDRVDRIAAFVHHVPFRQLAPGGAGRPRRFAFAAAYMGSDRIGQVLTACPKVTHVYCGHSHTRQSCRVGRLRLVNIGSTYIRKRLEVLDLPD